MSISRQERQDARRYQYEQTCVQNDQQEELSDLRRNYTEAKQLHYDAMSNLRKQISQTEGANSSTFTDAAGKTLDDYQRAIADLKEDYEYKVNNTKTYWEDELAMIETEANDVETEHEQDKVRVETQMEAVSQELQAVSQAISQEIQNCTIKLS
ncbi:MAG: hypothetical protein IJ877_07690 [Candidatus Gastranaerophilales bacterium]|nr:hypothetical protein [Candidatus Gastranaerophilales bacterium]